MILFATPLTLLPCKDTLEEILLKPNYKFTNRQNALVTFLLLLVCFLIQLPVASIGDAMTILGATTNSGIGFLFPVVYFLRLEK